MDTTITFKTKKKLHDAAKRTAHRLGIPLTTVINAQLAQFVTDGRFEVSLAPLPARVREWERTSREFREHPEQFRITSAEDFVASLRK